MLSRMLMRYWVSIGSGVLSGSRPWCSSLSVVISSPIGRRRLTGAARPFLSGGGGAGRWCRPSGRRPTNCSRCTRSPSAVRTHYTVGAPAAVMNGVRVCASGARLPTPLADIGRGRGRAPTEPCVHSGRQVAAGVRRKPPGRRQSCHWICRRKTDSQWPGFVRKLAERGARRQDRAFPNGLRLRKGGRLLSRGCTRSQHLESGAAD